MKKHAAPIIAAILLLLPVLYVGSYLTLVDSAGTLVQDANGTVVVELGLRGKTTARDEHYRAGGKVAATIFWPLEQIDRKVRSGAWER